MGWHNKNDCDKCGELHGCDDEGGCDDDDDDDDDDDAYEW